MTFLVKVLCNEVRVGLFFGFVSLSSHKGKIINISLVFLVKDTHSAHKKPNFQESMNQTNNDNLM